MSEGLQRSIACVWMPGLSLLAGKRARAHRASRAAAVVETEKAAVGAWIAGAVRRHWPLAVLLLMGAAALFTGLGRDHLWEDEGDTAVLASNILEHGVPQAWDGVTFVAPDYGQRLTRGFVMVAHPWLQYYAAAASFALFGETPLAARVPFAAAGLATIFVVYGMTFALARSRFAAFSAAALVTCSTQFLVFSRQARNYPFNALLTCLLVWQFHRLDSRKSAAIFAGLGILLFHTHPIGLAAVGMLGLLALVSPEFAGARRWCWPAALAVVLYALPWLALSLAGYEQNTTLLEDISRLVPRFLQFAIECASVTPIIGMAALYLALNLWRRCSAAKASALLAPGERSLTVACTAVIAGEAIAMVLTHTRASIWINGLHHAPAIIPLVMMPTGLLIAKAGASSRLLRAGLLATFICTKLVQIGPWTSWANPMTTFNLDTFVAFHVPRTVTDRLLRTSLVHYVRSLVRANPGVITRISEFLETHAEPDDVIITNYGWESLYFHTGLPQGAKISPAFPIYPAARAAQLPDYVFGSTGVRWIVWRRAWPAYFPEQDCQRILRHIQEIGMTARLAVSIPETMFENRENLHFRRFAGDAYIYPWYENLPSVLIFRVETFDEAIQHYRRDVDAHPDDVDALMNLGVALIATGKLAEAIPLFERAVAAHPGNGAAERNLANALFDGGRIAEAAVHAERAVVLRPDDPLAHDVFGRALASRGEFARAIRQFERAIRLDPAYQDARDHLARVQRFLDGAAAPR